MPKKKNKLKGVLILVVVDDGLVHTLDVEHAGEKGCLNPCCSGRWSSTEWKLQVRDTEM